VDAENNEHAGLFVLGWVHEAVGYFEGKIFTVPTESTRISQGNVA
jgi:hypothetical protein